MHFSIFYWWWDTYSQQNLIYIINFWIIIVLKFYLTLSSSLSFHLLLSLFSLNILLISRSIDLWMIDFSSLYSIDKLSFPSISIFSLHPLSPNIFFCFSNHQGAVFFFFLLLSISSFVFQWYREGTNFFLEYGQFHWLMAI